MIRALIKPIKKIFHFVIPCALTLYSITGIAQTQLDTVVEFPLDSAIWIYGEDGKSGIEDLKRARKIKMLGDTSLNGKVYNNMYLSINWDFEISSSDSLYAFVREANDSIYVRYNENQFIDTNEHLLYVFHDDTSSLDYRSISSAGDSLQIDFTEYVDELTVFPANSKCWKYEITIQDSLTQITQACNPFYVLPNVGELRWFFYNNYDYKGCDSLPIGYEPNRDILLRLKGFTFIKGGIQYCINIGLCTWFLGDSEVPSTNSANSTIEYYDQHGRRLDKDDLPVYKLIIKKTQVKNGSTSFKKVIRTNNSP